MPSILAVGFERSKIEAATEAEDSTSQTLSSDYPQRAAVVYALRTLKSGKGPGVP